MVDYKSLGLVNTREMFKKAINGSAIPDYYDLGIYSRYSMNWTARSNGEGAYNYTFKYDITYMMTKAQSVAFEKKLNKTVASLKLKKKSPMLYAPSLPYMNEMVQSPLRNTSDVSVVFSGSP